MELLNFFFHVAIELETEVRVLHFDQKMPLSQAVAFKYVPKVALALKWDWGWGFAEL